MKESPDKNIQNDGTTDKPSTRYAALCSGGVWSIAIFAWVLLAARGVVVIPGFITFLLVAFGSVLAGGIGYSYGQLVEKISKSATGDVNSVRIPLPESIAVGVAITFPIWALNLYLYEAKFPFSSPLITNILCGAAPAITSIFCILIGWTWARFMRAQGKPKSVFLVRCGMWVVGGTLGPTILIFVITNGYAAIHDWKNSAFEKDLVLFREIAKERAHSKHAANRSPNGPGRIKPKLLVLTNEGWIENEIQSQLQSEAANTSLELGTLVYVERRRSIARLYFVDFNNSSVFSIAETTNNDEEISRYLASLSRDENQ